ncbi:MAG: DUF3080 family protein [Oceanospirillales bacterium]|nr:MAG: DUF3080 family protein [Oceanospirillales bacterium]
MRKACLIALISVTILSGCAEPTVESMLRDYTQRVSNAIEHPIDFKPNQTSYPILPPRRERRIEIPELREGLIDVLRLRHCDLLPLISERNSNLGRVMTPSQVLQYELRFLPAIQQCEVYLQARVSEETDLTPLLSRVQEIRQHKETQLPYVIWNALYTSPEMEQQFSRSSTPLPLKSTGQINHIQQTLDPFLVIAQVTQETSRVLEAEFIQSLESYYEQLYRTELGSQWLRSVSLLTETMNAVADGIEQRLEERPICFNRQPNNRSTIIQNVFRNFYASEFQPYLASTDQFGQRWISLQNELLSALPVPKSSADYFSTIFDKNHQNGFLFAYEQAKIRHIAAWQKLLDHCGLTAGNLTDGHL